MGSTGAPAFAAEGKADRVVARTFRLLNGQTYVFEKYLGSDGEVRSLVMDSMGRIVEDSALLVAQHTIIGDKLDRLLRSRATQQNPERTFKVNIALAFPEEETKEVPESGGVEIEKGIPQRLTLDGEEVSEKEFEEHQREQERVQRERAAASMQAREARLRAWAKRYGLDKHEAVQRAIESTSNTMTLELTAEQINALVRANDETIRGIELFEKAEDDISEAMDATSISTSALPYTSTRGNDVGIYMTESGCANESRITNYDRLSGSETDHSRNVGAILRTVSPDSFIYCRGGAVLPNIGDLYGAILNALLGFDLFPELDPPIQIVTRSNSSNDNTSYTTVDRDWDNFVYSNRIPVFNSGGNTGNGTGNVRSPGKGLNVITVGNYDDANDTIASSSPFMDPETGNEKPEIVAPGTNIAAGGFTFSGTSQATPHAAAFAADMMSSSTYLKGKPYLVKAKMLAGATDAITGGSDKVGLGGIDFASAQWSGYYQWYEGENSAFAYFAETDGTDNAYVEKQIYIGDYWDRVRVALSWLTRGSYTYDHRNDAHPIGMDLDLQVYDPYGQYVGGSFSWDNPYEDVEFTPTVSGYYTFKINRYANRDASNKLRMGLYVNYFNN
jgi:hypothetical protein